jgi:VanZ family protein
VPGVGELFALSQYVIFGDKIGHAALFFGLLLLNYWTLVQWFASIRALVLAAGGVFLLSVGTEAFQSFVSSRGVSSMDLTANWVGILAAFTLIIVYHVVHPHLVLKRPKPRPGSHQVI